MHAFTVILQQVVQFFIMLVCGYVAARCGIISKAFLDGLAKLIMSILIPVLIFANAMDQTTWTMVVDSSVILALTAGLYVSLIIVMAVLAKGLGLSGNHGRIFQATTIFGNAGFIGIPLLTAAFPQQSGIYITLMSMVDQCFLWTYAVYLTTPQEALRTFQVQKFLNPALVSVVLALVLIFGGVTVPTPLDQALMTIGRAATPLALMYLGGLLYFSHWSIAAKAKEVYAGMVVKLLLYPVAFFYVASMVCPNKQAVQAISLIAALPTMTVIAMFAESHDNEGDFTLGVVLLMTIVSLFTLTAVSYVVFAP